MSFSAEWLALREPVDHDSVNAEIRQAVSARFADASHVSVVDLGCGSGSNLRSLYRTLPKTQSWRLVDHDPRLLRAARDRLAKWADQAVQDGDSLELRKDGRDLTVAFVEADLSAGYRASLFAGADLVTAAALFDLVSAASIAALAEAVANAGCAFQTILTYDGIAGWEPPHPADAAIRDSFNAHQVTDKGFGPAAGPGATDALAAAFAARGYRISRGLSPWRIDSAHAQLRRELDAGFAQAAREAGGVAPAAIEAWLEHRLSGDDRISIVGHEDLLAVPA